MTTENITHDYEAAAKKLGEHIIRFGVSVGIISKEAAGIHFNGPQLLQILDDANDLVLGIRKSTEAAKNRVKVDVFWEGQGYYFVEVKDLTKVSEQFDSLDACVRHIVLHGLELRDVRRTRGPVAQPAPPKLAASKPRDAE